VAFPWKRYRFEGLSLLLVALAVLTIVKPPHVQDHSRLAVSKAIVMRGSVRIDPWALTIGDRARYGGHWYSDKAPGLSFFAVPSVAVSDAVQGAEPWDGTWRRWLIRIFLNGPLLLALCFVLGRVSEGLAPGTGTTVAVATGLGTLLGPLAGVLFEHVGAALFALGAFLLAWRGLPLLAGLVAGLCVLWEYQAALALVVVAAYVASRGARRLALYVAGLAPPLAALAVYDSAAFGSPFHLSYRYVADDFTTLQHQGFFGVGLPSLATLHAVLLGGSGLRPGIGLLATSPVLVPAAIGLVLLWKDGGRREAAACACAAVAFVLCDAGYFAPYGGQSPGPRFAAPAIGFVLVGLPLALARWPRTVMLVVVASIALSFFNALRWGPNDAFALAVLPDTAWSLAGASRAVGVGVCCAFAAAATGVIALSRRVGREAVPAASLHAPS
jgi:hypothetical protein